MGDKLTILHADGTSTVVHPARAWSPGKVVLTDGVPPSVVHFPKGVVVQEPETVRRSLPDQVHDWPPKANEHGFNREQRRQAERKRRLRKKQFLKSEAYLKAKGAIPK